MTDGNKKVIPLLILPVIWGTYYVASQKLVGFTSSFTSGSSNSFCGIVGASGDYGQT